MARYALVIGRWHNVTIDQEAALRTSLAAVGDVDKVIFIITAAEQSRTKRHPLNITERKELLDGTARSLGKPFEIYGVNDTKDSDNWVDYITEAIRSGSGGTTVIHRDTTRLISANPDVIGHFERVGYTIQQPVFAGKMPADVLGLIRSRKPWTQLVTQATASVYRRYGLARVIRGLFADVLLTNDGELSTGRDFATYIKGMDAGLALKLTDILPWVLPGKIVDKGCGSGSLLMHLSARFRTSEVIGMDLSRALLHAAESQHYPHANVSVVHGNIIQRKFRPGSLSTVCISSVGHEAFSYNGYDLEVVRTLLRNTRTELQLGGRLISRDGIKPDFAGNVWMRCDDETELRFRRFAHDFKKKSASPGVKYTEREIDGAPWFLLSMHAANEFLSKKDYLKNWDIECNEEFGVFTLKQWCEELRALRYKILEARSYLNDWILANRYVDRVWLHADFSGNPGAVVPFPHSTAVLVAEAV